MDRLQDGREIKESLSGWSLASHNANSAATPRLLHLTQKILQQIFSRQGTEVGLPIDRIPHPLLLQRLQKGLFEISGDLSDKDESLCGDAALAAVQEPRPDRLRDAFYEIGIGEDDKRV